jgi:hypothetical protein
MCNEIINECDKGIQDFQMNKKANNKNNKTTTKRKKFNWNFELNSALLRITKAHPKWIRKKLH